MSETDKIENYVHTVPWGGGFPDWTRLIETFNPTANYFLEIGSFEGRSATHLIDHIFREGPSYLLCCIDTWAGGEEHSDLSMPMVEQIFSHNLAIALNQNKGKEVKVVTVKKPSHLGLADLISSGYAETFDFIYVDGSHQCPDVLTDLVMAFKLLKVGVGLLICDDYIWYPSSTGREGSLLHSPKMAIDAFANCNWDKLECVGLGWQASFRKLKS